VVQNTNNVLIFVGMSPMLRFVQGERERDKDRQTKKQIFLLSIYTMYRDVDKSLARPGRKQTTATEDFDVHISYL
jgi:hypothetical protein